MTIDDAIRWIGEIGIIPVVRAASLEEARRAVDAISAGGVPIVEITMTVPNAPAVIREVVRKYGSKLLTGAGTVATAASAEACLDSGAEFLVSPGLSLPVMRIAQARGKLAIPGALTPTEVMTAQGEGARLVKIFPCGNVGGPKYIKALRAPFPDLPLIPTGGVNLSNAADYLAAGSFALGVGTDLVDADALLHGNTKKITEMAAALAEAVRLARRTQHLNAVPLPPAP
jgi:2-dehydro-3-deoxyphosphogluconate aldolase/(4S)-4-hydroxy-2-oxoglutarate aldolase